MIAEDLDANPWLTRSTGAGGAGFDSQWDARFYPSDPPGGRDARTTLGSARCTAVRDAIGFNYNGDPTQRVIYTESHDEVANGRARVPEEIDPGNATSYFAKKRSTLAAGVVFSTPGIPMIFQGQEFLEDEYFRDEVPLDWERLETFSGIRDLYARLIELRRNLTGVDQGPQGFRIERPSPQRFGEDDRDITAGTRVASVTTWWCWPISRTRPGTTTGSECRDRVRGTASSTATTRHSTLRSEDTAPRSC